MMLEDVCIVDFGVNVSVPVKGYILPKFAAERQKELQQKAEHKGIGA